LVIKIYFGEKKIVTDEMERSKTSYKSNEFKLVGETDRTI